MTTHNDHDEQARLDDLCRHIAALMTEHQAGGAVFLITATSARWQLHLPELPARLIKPESPTSWRFDLDPADPDQSAAAETAIAFMTALRAMSWHCANLFQNLCDQIPDSHAGPRADTADTTAHEPQD